MSDRASTPLPHRLTQALADAPRLRLRRGDTLCRQGEPADALYVVESGMIECIFTDPAGVETPVLIVERGTVLGAAALLEDGLHPFSTRGLTECSLARLDGLAQRAVDEADGDLFAELLGTMADIVARLVEQTDSVKMQSATQRLAGYLLGLADAEAARRARGGRGEAGEGTDLRLLLSKQDLARHLGMTPQSLSRSLRRLGGLGVQVTGRRVRLSDLQGLRDFSDAY